MAVATDGLKRGGHRRSHEVVAADLGADIDVDYFFEALHTPVYGAFEEDDEYYSLGLALDETMPLLNYSSTESGMPRSY